MPTFGRIVPLIFLLAETMICKIHHFLRTSYFTLGNLLGSNNKKNIHQKKLRVKSPFSASLNPPLMVSFKTTTGQVNVRHGLVRDKMLGALHQWGIPFIAGWFIMDNPNLTWMINGELLCY